ncbi:MAG: hypothetical protein M5U28_09535 [Sandaracinaceae bacterium]|nr:hypothetical protein [Sandaracinaceae bacterium]
MQASSPVLRVALRVLTLQVTREELLGLDRRHLTLGLGVTWLVGIGRWWDDPGANLLQHLGLGSLAYVVALSLLLFGVLRPVAGADVTLSRVLTFVTLTAAPGLLYAIPVERFTALEVARTSTSASSRSWPRGASRCSSSSRAGSGSSPSSRWSSRASCRSR